MGLIPFLRVQNKIKLDKRLWNQLVLSRKWFAGNIYNSKFKKDFANFINNLKWFCAGPRKVPKLRSSKMLTEISRTNIL